jgi:hypothetical protein
LRELKPAAAALRLKLEEIKTQAEPKSLEKVFQTAKQKQVSAIMTTGSPFFLSERACRQVPLSRYLLPAGVYQ